MNPKEKAVLAETLDKMGEDLIFMDNLGDSDYLELSSIIEQASQALEKVELEDILDQEMPLSQVICPNCCKGQKLKGVKLLTKAGAFSNLR